MVDMVVVKNTSLENSSLGPESLCVGWERGAAVDTIIIGDAIGNAVRDGVGGNDGECEGSE